RYFAGRQPLTAGGACIAALYRAGATDRFGPPYEERHRPDQPDEGGRVIAAFLLNPVTLYFWIRHGGLALFRIASEYLRARFSRTARASGERSPACCPTTRSPNIAGWPSRRTAWCRRGASRSPTRAVSRTSISLTWPDGSTRVRCSRATRAWPSTRRISPGLGS